MSLNHFVGLCRTNCNNNMESAQYLGLSYYIIIINKYILDIYLFTLYIYIYIYIHTHTHTHTHTHAKSFCCHSELDSPIDFYPLFPKIIAANSLYSSRFGFFVYGISNFVGYSMPKPSLQKNNHSIIQPITARLMGFPYLSPKALV